MKGKTKTSVGRCARKATHDCQNAFNLTNVINFRYIMDGNARNDILTSVLDCGVRTKTRLPDYVF